MVTVTGLIAALSGPTNERRARRTSRIIRAFAVLFLLLAWCGFTALSAYLIWSEWHAPEPSSNSPFVAVMWYALAAWLAAFLALLVVAARDRSGEASPPVVVALRDLLGRHYDHLTPLARFQPMPDAATTATQWPLTLGPLRFGALRRHPALFGVFWSFVAIGTPAIICAQSNWPSLAATQYPPVLYLVLAGFVALALGGTALAWLRTRARARRRGPKLILDERGIHAGNGLSAFTLAWDQIRGLWQVVVAPPLPNTTTPDFTPALDANLIVYLADDGAAPLQWWLTGTASEAEVKASEALLRQIVTRTGRPLRDASALVYEIVRQTVPQSRAMLGQLMRGGGTSGVGQAVHEALRQSPATQRKTSPLKIAAVVVVAALLAVANAALPLGELRLEHARSHVAATYLAALHSSGSLYSTDFAANDGNWPEHAALDTDFRAYSFVGSAYHLTGSKPDRYISALYPARCSDVAVEVTVTQREATMPVASLGYPAGAGLVVHATGGYGTMLAFYIATDGHWMLARYAQVDDHASDNWHNLDDGFSAAAHQGLGAANTLLLVQRQRHLTLYINGTRVVDRDYSSSYYGAVPEFGFAVVYSDQSGIDAAFSHFALYRLPPQPDFWAALRTG